MRYVLIFWLLPVGTLAAWLYFASHDINFGTTFFSRDMYDLVFRLYGQVLGMDPSLLPPLIWKALVVDTLLVLLIWAFRRRKTIHGWWVARRTATSAVARSS